MLSNALVMYSGEQYVFRGEGRRYRCILCIADVLCTYPATFVNNTWNTHDNTPKYKKVRIGRKKCPLWEEGVYVTRETRSRDVGDDGASRTVI